MCLFSDSLFFKLATSSLICLYYMRLSPSNYPYKVNNLFFLYSINFQLLFQFYSNLNYFHFFFVNYPQARLCTPQDSTLIQIDRQHRDAPHAENRAVQAVPCCPCAWALKPAGCPDGRRRHVRSRPTATAPRSAPEAPAPCHPVLSPRSCKRHRH